ncbi:unnamed protein product [Mytilus edulis]|uniref:PHR domain-containing protein n=1 Tax=Mytilus edulis TaxID=6550 RepID=A0A8S3PMT4_MYTED|nr:unnamed protein product [Mytilus edulis]
MKTDISRNLEKAFEVIFEQSKSNITVKSSNTAILTVNRFGTIHPNWAKKGVDAICFSVSKDIQLHGILSYGCLDGKSICKVKATLKENMSELIVVSKNLESKEAENGLLRVFFGTSKTFNKYKVSYCRRYGRTGIVPIWHARKVYNNSKRNCV